MTPTACGEFDADFRIETGTASSNFTLDAATYVVDIVTTDLSRFWIPRSR